MAIYKLADGVAQFYGSLDGATFQKCCTVFSMRSRKMPLKKKTAKTTRVRNRFGAYASQWRQRSGAQKTSFNSRESLYPRVDSLGASYDITGQNLYSSSNIRAAYIFMGAINDLANPIAQPSNVFRSCGINVGLQTAAFRLNSDTVPANFNLLTFVSPPVSLGTTDFPLEKMKLLSNINPGNSTNFNQWAAYTALFGNLDPNTNAKVFAEFHLIQRITAQINKVVTGYGFIF